VIRPRDRALRVAASAGWLLLVLPAAVVLLSVALSPDSTWTARIALAGFTSVAVMRPEAAVMITIALGGFSMILSHLAGVPSVRVAEVLVVASLAGCFARAVPPNSPYRRAMTSSLSVPVVLFAMTTVASAIVWQRVHQFQTGDASVYFAGLVKFVTRDYFTQPGDFWPLVTAAVILEGLALYVVTAALCRVSATFSEQALRMLAVGGAGLAMMSLVRLAEVLLRNPGAIEAMRQTATGVRISPQIPDYIAAGSYFGLCWIVGLALAMVSGWSRSVWLVVSAVLMAGIYLTGSRSVIAAALAGLVPLLAMLVRRRAVFGRIVAAAAVLAVVLMVVTYSTFIGRGPLASRQAKDSLFVRAELLRAGLRVMETRPLFGVGLDRFFVLAPALASPDLHRLWQSRMNPHNDFLRFGAELGLAGFACFLFILAGEAWRIRRAVRAAPDLRLVGVAGGLVAFLVTSLVSNPLMVREVSYVFWTALGLAAGHAVNLLSAADVPGEQGVELRGSRMPLSRFRWAGALLIGALIFVSIPSRARTELAGLDLRRVSFGFHEWGKEPDGTLARWTGPQATLYVKGHTRLIEIPMSGVVLNGTSQHVEVRVDGQLVDRLIVGSEWRRARVRLPGLPSPDPRRVDLAISPTWVPADLISGNNDRRNLGVKVGEVKVIIPP
jgi:O-antigen ligase